MKTCPRCKAAKPLTEFWVRRTRGGTPSSRCKACSADAQREWRRKQPDYDKRRYQTVKVETRERHLIRKYGVSLDDYNEMLEEQGGKCAICLTTPDTQRYGVLHVDHCHTTGQVRGLLCRGCNNALGVIGDDPRALLRAVAYLTKHDAVEAAEEAVERGQIPELIGRAILASREAA